MQIHAGAKNPIKLMRMSRNSTGEPFVAFFHTSFLPLHPSFLAAEVFFFGDLFVKRSSDNLINE